jgi:hypothetical protein
VLARRTVKAADVKETMLKYWKYWKYWKVLLIVFMIPRDGSQ